MTGWASIHGYPVGVLANARGVLFSDEAKKATEFILLANQTDTPLVFLQNTTGYMVGASYEQGGIIKDGAKMINAVTNCDRPAPDRQHGAVLRRRQLRHVRPGLRSALHVRLARRQDGRDGRRSSSPACCRSSAGQSAEAAGRPFDEEADRARAGARSRRRSSRVALRSSSPARLYDDGIIDPRDTRTVLGIALSAVHSDAVAGRRGFGVFRM